MEYEIGSGEFEVTDQDRAMAMEYIDEVVHSNPGLCYHNPNYPSSNNGDYFAPEKEDYPYYIEEYFSKPLQGRIDKKDDEIQETKEAKKNSDEAYSKVAGSRPSLISERDLHSNDGVKRILNKLNEQKAKLEELEGDKGKFLRISNVLIRDIEFIIEYLLKKGFCIARI